MKVVHITIVLDIFCVSMNILQTAYKSFSFNLYAIYFIIMIYIPKCLIDTCAWTLMCWGIKTKGKD